jgi:hypothetical protein
MAVIGHVSDLNLSDLLTFNSGGNTYGSVPPTNSGSPDGDLNEAPPLPPWTIGGFNQINGYGNEVGGGA